MKNKSMKLICGGMILAMAVMFTACGKDQALSQFKKEIDDFCSSISEFDTAINNIDVQADPDAAAREILEYLDELDTEFAQFAELDFPEEFDYLETLADEAGEYMTEAVRSFHEAYGNDTYDEAMASSEYEYARQNYSRAYKRIQIIITFLHGDVPDDMDLNADMEKGLPN